MGYNVLDSIANAVLTLPKKIMYAIIFITLLAVDKLVYNLDRAFNQDTSILLAVYGAYREAVYRALGTVYPVLFDFFTFQFEYIHSRAYGSIVFALIFFFLLTLTFYQIVSFGFDIVDGDSQDTTPFFIKLPVTILIVVVLSIIVYHGLGESGISHMPFTNGTTDMVSNASNAISAQNASDAVVIDMIG